jgi:cysteine desulfurase
MHIYLDANSTTRLDPSVRQAMVAAWQASYMNPASQHRPGQIARQRLELLRSEISRRLGAGRNDRLIFTSGGTESNNLAVIGLAGGLARPATGATPEVIVSAIEHPAVLGAAEFLRSNGFLIKQIPVDRQGRARIDTLSQLITPDTRLVSLMLANNETGVIQDVQGAARICRDRSVPLHCDAVQAVGKLPIDFAQSGLAALTLTAHKLHGPGSIGGLLIPENSRLQPILFGGSQQLGQRPGTEDVVLATGFAKAVQLAVDAMDDRCRHMRKLRDLFEEMVLSELPDTVISGADAERLPHTSNLSFPGRGPYRTVNRQTLLMAADVAGVAISTGSACTSGSSEPSHVLLAMGCPSEVV